MKPLSINIVGLELKAHHFSFQLDDRFLQEYGQGYLPGGQFSVEVVLDKHETFIEADFKIEGTVTLTCDRSLDRFDFPIQLKKRILFKYGEEDMELTDEIILISRDHATLDLGQLVYEFIGLSIPMKKLHPRFREEDENGGSEDGKMIYSTMPGDDHQDDGLTDPVWEKLRKLK
ncbi:MAG: DUF177 domain-containing protein [Cyclobacteriaceae bacterium]|nr:DUF177 domain-containing protein [Cyclobacteriaceae bacterium]MCB9238800.1 DUF177 domain-containing protein [Flammeovirgaceae bacterium]MCB0498076.1 DUF177 domain-containing protein [Cyclobacteriaceae bacterium]MCO5270519.1 DUF177 domain-containing protein [Cyclobacteriaceae bacterium]MCW5901040.1 DUF177 domain-containing protein [Cyclobacteriaceae bacterium]